MNKNLHNQYVECVNYGCNGVATLSYEVWLETKLLDSRKHAKRQSSQANATTNKLKAEISKSLTQFDDMAIEDIEAVDCMGFICLMRQLSSIKT